MGQLYIVHGQMLVIANVFKYRTSEKVQFIKRKIQRY